MSLSNWSVLIVENQIFSRMIALELYVIKKGVSLVDLLGIVQYAHRT